jgi:hypothetical protein
MNGLLGQHSFRQDDSRLTEFDIDNMELNSCIQQALFTKLLTPLDGLWQLRDKKRDRIFSFRSEIRPPPPATLDEFPALRNIQFFDHVEINLFPLTIRLPHDHYAPFRRFFFPADLRQDAVEDATKDKFLPAHGASFSVAAPQLSTASRRAMLVYKPSNSAVPDRQPAVSRSASVKRYNTAIVRRRTTKRMTKSVAVPPKSNSSNEALAIASGAAISGAMPAMLKALNSMHAQTLSSQLDLAARQQSASVASTSAKSHRKHVGLKTAAAQKLLGATSANHVELEAERVWREERRAAREREHRRRRAGELQCYYFRYLRIGEIEMRLSYKGGLIDVDDRALFVQPFVASSKLFSFNKLFREYEVHVGFDALRSVTGSSEVSSRWTSLKNAVRPLVNWDADDVPQTPRAAAARAALPSTGKKKKSFSLGTFLVIFIVYSIISLIHFLFLVWQSNGSDLRRKSLRMTMMHCRVRIRMPLNKLCWMKS